MTDRLVGELLREISEEFRASIDRHGLFTSAHEGYAIILEEVDELWDEVKKSDRSPDTLQLIRAEAIQVAAMGAKMMLFIDAKLAEIIPGTEK